MSETTPEQKDDNYKEGVIDGVAKAFEFAMGVVNDAADQGELGTKARKLLKQRVEEALVEKQLELREACGEW